MMWIVDLCTQPATLPVWPTFHQCLIVYPCMTVNVYISQLWLVERAPLVGFESMSYPLMNKGSSVDRAETNQIVVV